MEYVRRIHGTPTFVIPAKDMSCVDELLARARQDIVVDLALTGKSLISIHIRMISYRRGLILLTAGPSKGNWPLRKYAPINDPRKKENRSPFNKVEETGKLGGSFAL